MFIHYISVENSNSYKQMQKSARYSIHYIDLHSLKTVEVNLYFFLDSFILFILKKDKTTKNMNE